MYLLFPLTKGHLSNLATVSWQIGWPYNRGTSVLVPVFLYNPTRLVHISVSVCDLLSQTVSPHPTPHTHPPKLSQPVTLRVCHRSPVPWAKSFHVTGDYIRWPRSARLMSVPVQTFKLPVFMRPVSVN